jgi:hypothetical protein
MNIRWTLPFFFALVFPQLIQPAQAQIVPGTGQQIVEVFDDFEDPTWAFNLNLPKASSNIDKTERHPSGFSNNRLYLESLYRGTPDFVRRIETPPGGLRGSTGSLAMQTLNSGIPGQRSFTFQQDDLIAGVQQKLGYMMPVSWSPSYVCRVYMPPFDQWEQRHGSHFGFRADCTTTINKPSKTGRFFKTSKTNKALEQYWPGFFVQLNLKQKTGEKEDSAILLIRSDQNGHEVPGPKITHPGWWTLGMSFTPDGKVHYYAHEGIADLTAKDHLYSNFPYGYRCEQTSTFFFNIVNQDDGRTWSTRWIVDDPKVFVASGTYRPSVPAQAAQVPATTAAPQVAAKPVSPATQTPAVAPQPAAPTQPIAAIPVTPPVKTALAPPVTPVPARAVPVIASKPEVISSLPPLATAPVAITPPTPAAIPVAIPVAIPAVTPQITPELQIPRPEAIPSPVEENPVEENPAEENLSQDNLAEESQSQEQPQQEEQPLIESPQPVETAPAPPTPVLPIPAAAPALPQ